MNGCKILLVLIAMLCLGLPATAHANATDGLPDVFETCASNGAAAAVPAVTLTNSDFTAKVVYCVQYAVGQASTSLLNSLSGYMTGLVVITFIFAIIIFGMQMFSGAGEMKSKAPAFFLRFAIVGFFSYNMGGLFPFVFGIEQQLMTLVCGSFSPWKQIDLFIGMLVGFAPCIVLAQGLLGVVLAILFSPDIGFAVFIAGMMALAEVVFFIFDVVYTYLMAVVTIGFQVAISPFTIPPAIFHFTEKYTTRWINMLIAAMLVPVLLFAFLSLSLGIFNVLISNILTILGATCPQIPPGSLCDCSIDFHTFWKMGKAWMTWLAPSDASFDAELRNIDPIGISVPPVGASVNPFLRLGVSINPASFPRIDFGSVAKDWAVESQLIFSFVALWVYASIIKDIAARIPQVAESIASSISGISLQSSPLTRLAKGEGTEYQKFELAKYDGLKPGGGGGE